MYLLLLSIMLSLCYIYVIYSIIISIYISLHIHTLYLYMDIPQAQDSAQLPLPEVKESQLSPVLRKWIFSVHLEVVENQILSG